VATPIAGTADASALVPSPINRRVKPLGAPGLAFETWDPSNQFLLETPTLHFVIRSHKPQASHSPFLCHPERTRISYFTALTGATYVVLPKENHMHLTEAATVDRKSGGADLSRHAVERSAVSLDRQSREWATMFPNPDEILTKLYFAGSSSPVLMYCCEASCAGS
jgi:hypothetical protein